MELRVVIIRKYTRYRVGYERYRGDRKMRRGIGILKFTRT